MGTILSVNNLVKSYGERQVLHGVSFQVEKGEIFALLGINGAGKTTTLECIEGLKKYDSGEIVFHTNNKGNNLYNFIGIQLQSSAIPGNITVFEAYRLFCLAGKVKADKELLERFGLTPILNKQYYSLSTGQKRRLHLVLALVHNPEILFLDEPTAGLDVEGQVALHEEILQLKQTGKTIILASHDMAEVEKLCDRIAILKEGRIGFVGRSDELIATCKDKHEIALKTDITTRESIVKVLQYSQFIKSENGYDIYQCDQLSEGMLELLQTYRDRNCPVLDIQIKKSTLEEKFIEFSREESA